MDTDVSSPENSAGTHVAAREVRSRHVERLEAADSDLRVAAAVQGPLVDVRAADDDVLQGSRRVP